MKILFTSVGRRVELVQSFIDARKKLSENVVIIGADNSLLAPALYFCDEKIITPKISDSNYILFLIEYCKNNYIDCLIPTIDTDLLLLSEYKNEFKENGTVVLVSSYDKVSICRDKNKTYKYFVSLGLNSPETYNNYEKYNNIFPAFIKPKDGSSSIEAYKINNEKELEFYAGKIKDYIIQPLIKGVEYTVDAFCDFDGNPIFITPRIRLAVRSGEVLKTKITQDEEIINETRKILYDFKPSGQITIQLIKNEIDNKNYYIEINPRFGGGAPLSIKAGADSSEVVIRLLRGEKIKYIDKAANDNEIFLRFDQSISITDKEND